MAKINTPRKKNFNFSLKLLQWYDRYGRNLPWREKDGRAPSPYHTWLSEIMLQQTGVATVIPYYQNFTRRWPNIRALAAASEGEILKQWEGLGYYSRAHNLLKCARQVVADHKGKLPRDIKMLNDLPGIGPYTANAIAAIAFDQPAVVVDGNVERVMARLFGYAQPINTPKGKKDLTALAASLSPLKRSGDYAQGLMDLGAMICTPKNPDCAHCPWRTACKAFALGKTAQWPVKTKKKATPTRYAVAYVVTDKTGHILLQQRPAKGLLGGLWEFPGTQARAKPFTSSEIQAHHPFITSPSRHVTTPVSHVFSHFKLVTHVIAVSLKRRVKTQGQWFAPDALPAMATLHTKILQATVPPLAMAQKKRKMAVMRLVPILLALLLISLPARADETEHYRDPTPVMLSDYFFDSGMIKLEQDKDVVEYLSLKDCTLYNMAKDDMFMQQQMAQQMNAGQAQRTKMFNKNLLIRLPGNVVVTRYNFNTQSFDLLPETQLKKVGSMVITDNFQLPCGKGRSGDLRRFPKAYAVKLNFPVSLLRVPLQSKTAKSVYETLDDTGRANAPKILYIWVYLSIEGALPSTPRNHERATLLGQVDMIDIFTNSERTKRLKHLDYRETY